VKACEARGERKRFFWHCDDKCGAKDRVATCQSCGVLTLLNWKPKEVNNG